MPWASRVSNEAFFHMSSIVTLVRVFCSEKIALDNALCKFLSIFLQLSPYKKFHIVQFEGITSPRGQTIDRTRDADIM